MLETLQHSSPSSVAEAVTLLPGHEGSCQADGCTSDMIEQSVWHQKSRICDKHMSGMFLKQGKPQQFCQQCGRSHNLDAFDTGRRSCRTQLAKHAARLVQMFVLPCGLPACAFQRLHLTDTIPVAGYTKERVQRGY